MSRVLRWGGIYLFLLLLWSGIGAYNQQQRQLLASLQDEKESLEQTYNLLIVNQVRQTSPHRLYGWARQQGFVPLSQGRWQWEASRP